MTVICHDRYFLLCFFWLLSFLLRKCRYSFKAYQIRYLIKQKLTHQTGCTQSFPFYDSQLLFYVIYFASKSNLGVCIVPNLRIHVLVLNLVRSLWERLDPWGNFQCYFTDLMQFPMIYQDDIISLPSQILYIFGDLIYRPIR